MSLRSRLGGFFDGSMRANAIALVTHQLASATLGFVYWLLAAHLYSIETVGTSSAVISTLQLVSGLAQLGLVSGMQRFIPRAGRRARRLAVSAYGVATVSAAIAGVIALRIAHAITPGRGLLGGIAPGWIVVAAVAWTLFYLQDGVLVGLREAVWVLVENFAYNLAKIILLVVGAQLLASSGIVVSWFLPVPFAVLGVTWLVFGRLLHPRRVAEREEPADQVTAREIVTSLSADHVGATVNEAGLRLLPLLVVSLLGVAANAYFYQAWMISTVLALVAGGMANSFVAETAADRTRVGPNSRAILRTMLVLLVPAAVVLGLGAPVVLRIFGPEYAREGAAVLRLLAIAVLPVTVNAWFIAYLRVMGLVKRLIAFQVLTSVVLVTLTYVGLRLFGIAGAGAAHLVAQTGAATFALATTRRVRAAGPAEGDGDLRRGDWRYLLPGPAPQRVALLAEGPLAHSASRLGAEPVTGGADLCVVGAPGSASLRRANASLVPGGLCYAEWRASSARRIRALHRRAGLGDPVVYWPAPVRSRARVWMRVPTAAADIRMALGSLMPHVPGPRWVQRFATASAASALQIGLLPTLVSVARAPGGQPDTDADFAEWLGHAIERTSQTPSDSFVLMRTGGSYDESKINWLVFERSTGKLGWIAKAPRHPASYDSLQHEHDTLERLLDAPLPIGVPKPLLRSAEPGFPVFVQSAIDGTPLGEHAVTVGFGPSATLLAEQLALLVRTEPMEPSPSAEWRARLVDPWVKRLEDQLDGIGDPLMVERVRAALGELGPLPLGWTHNDCTPWNVLVSDGHLRIFDWETAEERGLPATDLIYCLATLAFALDGTDSTPRAIETYRRLLDREDERGAAFESALHAYARRTGLHDEDLSRLRVLTWLVHATHDLHNIFSAAGGRDASLLPRCVCLPILRAEVERHLQRAVPESAESPAGMPVVAGEALFVSPHLDDAVLSCGGAIRRLASRGTRVTVATVFTADVPASKGISCLAENCHEIWGVGDQPFAARREEDRRALAALGATALHLGFLDAIYRTRPGGSPLYETSQRCSPDAEDGRSCLVALTERLRELIGAHPGATVFCPAGIGGHVDHTLVRQAVEAAGAEHLVYYDEYPYVAWTARTYGTGRAGVASYSLRPALSELNAHVAAARQYESQVPGLFPSPLGQLFGILRQRVPWTRSFLPAAPGRLEPAVARMEARLSSDRERHGERYHWTDTGWDGPFPSAGA